MKIIILIVEYDGVAGIRMEEDFFEGIGFYSL